MKLCFSEEFWKEFRQLSPHVQKQAKQAFEHFALDPRYPSLRFKCVNKSEAKYSIRVDRTHRVLGYMQGGEVIWYWIGPHDEYERLI